MNILDCTLRDGGYYTNWDFSQDTVDSYIDAMNQLPVTHIEVGYRNVPQKAYLGKYGYCPAYELKRIRERFNKKLLVMVNEKSTKPEDVESLLGPVSQYIDMVRIAIDPKNLSRSIKLAEAIKKQGLGVGMNVMYMSAWRDSAQFLNELPAVNDVADVFCMVDSYGGVSPDEVREIFGTVKSRVNIPIGFHGHNNLQLALINSLTAIDLGVDYVDATVLGMGRGAGNLNLELLLTYLNRNSGLSVDFNVLGDVISAFSLLQERYQWGTNLPYMLSGAYSLPQKDVMDWVANRVYTFNSIVRALDNKRNNMKDNAKYPICEFSDKCDEAIVIGGGSTVCEHIYGIKNYIATRKNVALIFATARHASLFNDVECAKYYVIVGAEGKRLAKNVDLDDFTDKVILPPYPRPMGTEVPDKVKEQTFELQAIDFVEGYGDSCTAVALQTALNIADAKSIRVVGYDGYAGNILSEKEMALTTENRTIFSALNVVAGQNARSLTPSIYKELETVSIYQNF